MLSGGTVYVQREVGVKKKGGEACNKNNDVKYHVVIVTTTTTNINFSSSNDVKSYLSHSTEFLCCELDF